MVIKDSNAEGPNAPHSEQRYKAGKHTSKLKETIPHAECDLGPRPVSIIDLVKHRRSLNPQQQLAYDIITDHFVPKFVVKSRAESPPRMLMTGPGGTGKTYVVNSVKEVMSSNGCGHRIHF